MLLTPSSFLVASNSKAGKTLLVRDLIVSHYWMFDNPLEEVVWLYHKNARDEELVTHLKQKLSIPIQFVEGFPAEDISEGRLFKTNGLKCLVLDDVVISALKSPTFIDLFTVLSHHQSIVVIAIIQNLHADTASQRQIMNNIIRNLSYLVLFPDRRQLPACKQLARAYFSGEEQELIAPFKHMIENKKKYNYMLIDFEQASVRFNCLRPTDEGFKFTHADSKMKKTMLKRESFQEMLLRKLNKLTTEDGSFIYPGPEDASERTGSDLNSLVAYTVHEANEKPLDYDIFRNFLINNMKIPDHLLYIAKKK